MLVLTNRGFVHAPWLGLRLQIQGTGRAPASLQFSNPVAFQFAFQPEPGQPAVLISCDSQHNASSCLTQLKRNGDRSLNLERLPVEKKWFVAPLLHCFDRCGSQHGVTTHDLQVLNIAVLVDNRR